MKTAALVVVFYLLFTSATLAFCHLVVKLAGIR
jgi:hypothetical protein